MFGVMHSLISLVSHPFIHWFICSSIHSISLRIPIMYIFQHSMHSTNSIHSIPLSSVQRKVLESRAGSVAMATAGRQPVLRHRRPLSPATRPVCPSYVAVDTRAGRTGGHSGGSILYENLLPINRTQQFLRNITVY